MRTLIKNGAITALVAIMMLSGCGTKPTISDNKTNTQTNLLPEVETLNPVTDTEQNDLSAYSKFNGTWRRKLAVGSWQYVIDIGKKAYTAMQIGKDYADELGTYDLEPYDDTRLGSGGVIFELQDDDTLITYLENNTTKRDIYYRYTDDTEINTYDYTDNNTPSISTTMGEKNALSAAKQYLDVAAFSYNGLVEQLEYEGYTHSEAVYGAEYCGADWNEQAVKSAEQYLSIMSFSRSGLIEQLEYEGFTHEQAVYGVEQNGY